MNIILNYNDYKKELEINENMSIGEVQETILNICSLIIYNIEYSEIIFLEKDNNIENKIIMGKEELPFNKTLKYFIEEFNVSEIVKINLYDRKRDEHGRVSDKDLKKRKE